jgi:hypothetical protein
MTPRATRALEILRAGGKFRYALTTGWQGREQFQWSLIGSNGARAHGYGHHTYHELVKAGFDFTYEPSGFTGSASYHALKE